MSSRPFGLIIDIWKKGKNALNFGLSCVQKHVSSSMVELPLLSKIRPHVRGFMLLVGSAHGVSLLV